MQIIGTTANDFTFLVEATRDELLVIMGKGSSSYTDRRETKIAPGCRFDVVNTYDYLKTALDRKNHLLSLAESLEKEASQVRRLAEKADTIITPPPKKVKA